MRLLLVLGAAAAALYIAGPTQEAKANYCVDEDDVGKNCGFATLRQCEDARAGVGGFCVQDTFGRPTVQARSAPATKRLKAAR